VVKQIKEIRKAPFAKTKINNIRQATAVNWP
jgi:hypothetical protein